MRAATVAKSASAPCSRICLRRAVQVLRCARPVSRLVARSQTEKKSPANAAPSSVEEDVPVWVKREEQRRLQKEFGDGPKDLPWPLYLVMSLLTAIAAIGSMFEYSNHNAIFGVVPPDSPAWAPILGFFAFTGLPSAGFFFFKAVSGANEAAELQDKLDGYMD